MAQVQLKVSTKIGPLYLIASDKALNGVYWTKQSAPMMTTEFTPAAKILKTAQLQLTEYFDGQRKKFDLPLRVQGTEFQKRVWKQLSKINYGSTRSYKDIATKIRNKKASRAVGTANGQNPLCIIIPCHRVISSDGSLGGYSGGLEIKTKLLNLEKNLIELKFFY